MTLVASLVRYGRRCPRTLHSQFFLPKVASHGTRGYHVQVQGQDAKIEDIRNIGIIAHVDAGKTTTTERMLYYSGLKSRLGNVDHADTTTDFLPMERERGITIQSAAITFNWPLPASGVVPKTINLIDTPGHQDFRFEVDRCLPVLDGAVCIIDSVKGVEAHTERVWSSAQNFNIPRLVFVNKLDRDGASFKRSVRDIAAKLNAWPLVCQIPLWEKETFVGVVDVIDCVGFRWRTVDKWSLMQKAQLMEKPELWTEVQTARSKLIERLCLIDEDLLEEFVEHGEDLPSASIKKSIRHAISSGDGSVAPVFAGSSLRNMGVQPLLDAIVDYLPSPQDRPSVDVYVGSEKHSLNNLLKKELPPPKKNAFGAEIASAVAVASVFKVINGVKNVKDHTLLTASRGMSTFVRIYHGSLSKQSQLWNANLAKPDKPTSILHVSADRTSEIPHLSVGQIGALDGLKEARTGDTLLVLPPQVLKNDKSPLKSLTLRPAEISPGVAFISIEPLSNTEMKNTQDALEKLSREDPSLRWSLNEKTEIFELSGMGKLHLEVAIDQLKTVHKIKAVWSNIKVDYKECVLEPTGPHHMLYERAVANKAGKAGCTAALGPLEESHERMNGKGIFRQHGNLFNVKIVCQESPRFEMDLVRQQLYNGAVAAMARGPRRGSPLHGCFVDLTFDSLTDFYGPGTDGQIVKAAYHAVYKALEHAHASHSVGILEPVMTVNLTCPEEAGGPIQHDISSARGGVVLEVMDSTAGAAESGIDLSQVYAPPDPYDTVHSLREAKTAKQRTQDIVAKVPLSEMLDYDNVLRSKTGGRHSLSMHFDSFQQVKGPREKNL